MTPIMIYAIVVFVVAYALIISERFNKTTVALVGAGLMVCLPVLDSPTCSTPRTTESTGTSSF
jgi:Na+/H+ antiporter NhaD/arsenite permease-like protein